MKNIKTKHYLILVTIVLVTLFTQTGCTGEPSLAQTKDEVPVTRTISISGSGRVSAQPDVAVVMLGVQTEAEEASAALSQNNTRMQSLIDALRDADIASEDLQTRSIQLRPRYEDSRPVEGEPQIIGYVATNTVEIRVRDLDALGELLDSAIEAGGNTIQGLSFEVSDPTEMLNQAREAAWNEAQRKATQLAELAGATLGGIVSIDESSQTPSPFVREAIGGAGGGIPVEPGSQDLQVNVQVTWELIPR